MADQASEMAADAKKDANMANQESHEAVEKPAMPKKKGMAKGKKMDCTTKKP